MKFKTGTGIRSEKQPYFSRPTKIPQLSDEILLMRHFIAFLTLIIAGNALAVAEEVPLPPSRRPIWLEPHTFAEAVAGLNIDAAHIRSEPTACDARLTGLAAIELLPRLIGPGACGGRDMVEVDAVLLPDNKRITLEPPAVLNCAIAEAFANWLCDAAAPRVSTLGSALIAVEIYDSYECRPRNRMPGGKLSAHASGNALDLRAFRLTDGRRLELTDVNVDRALRVALHDTACQRFTTVLGPGADSHHEGHIYLDAILRNSGYRICQWEVREPLPYASLVGATVPLPRARPIPVTTR
jgi:hypothetical protein